MDESQLVQIMSMVISIAMFVIPACMWYFMIYSQKHDKDDVFMVIFLSTFFGMVGFVFLAIFFYCFLGGDCVVSR